MREHEVDRLLWELIDGVIAPGDRAALDAHLAGDAAARERLAEMRSLAQLLASVEELPVPEAVPAGVSRALVGRQVPRPASRVWAPWLDELFTPRWRVRLAWATVGLAVGIAAGIVAVSGLRKPLAEDVSKYYGAMAHGRGDVGQGLRLALADASGALAVQRDGRILMIELAVDRPEAAPVVLALVGTELKLEGLQAGAQASVVVDSEGHRVTLTADPVGRSLLRVATPGEDAVVGLRVSAGERVLLEREIRVGEVPAL